MNETNETRALAGVSRDGLTALHARIAPRFRRREARERARRYLDGLLRRIERKNGWQLAEALSEGGPQGMQRPRVEVLVLHQVDVAHAPLTQLGDHAIAPTHQRARRQRLE